jgi:hypothetical protein
MHTDEQKKFDIRNIERNIKSGIVTQKDYETYLAKLPDIGDKVFNLEDALKDPRESESRKESEGRPKKKETKKKVKGKGK